MTENAERSSLPTEKVGAFGSLQIPGFRWLLMGGILAYATNWMQQVILNWLVYDITGSGTILGSISLVMSAASLSMVFVVGILVDNYNRRKLMLAETACMVILTLVMGFMLITGHASVALLFVFTFIFGLILPIDGNLRQVLVFDLVPRALVPAAMALNQTGWSVMRFLGPSIGGFLLIWFGAGGSFLVQSAIMVLVILSISRIKLSERKKDPQRASPLQNIRDGMRYVFAKPVIRIFTLIGILLPILVVPIFTTLPPIYAVQVYGDPSGKILGFLMAAVGVGGALGGFTIAFLRRYQRWGILQLVALFFVCVSLIAFALVSNLIIALILLAIAGYFEIIFLSMNQTMIQLSISDQLRSRVTAVVGLTWILSPVGNILAGAGSDFFKNPKVITIILSGAAALVLLIILLISPTVRNYRLSNAIAADKSKALE